MKVSSDLKKIRQASSEILKSLDARKPGEGFLFDIKLAVEEAMINAIKYGNKSDPKKNVTVDYDIKGDSLVVAVEDEGDGFVHGDLPDPTKNENLRKLGGRGLFLIRNVMDRVEFNSRGNRITMTKLFPKK